MVLRVAHTRLDSPVKERPAAHMWVESPEMAFLVARSRAANPARLARDSLPDRRGTRDRLVGLLPRRVRRWSRRGPAPVDRLAVRQTSAHIRRSLRMHHTAWQAEQERLALREMALVLARQDFCRSSGRWSPGYRRYCTRRMDTASFFSSFARRDTKRYHMISTETGTYRASPSTTTGPMETASSMKCRSSITHTWPPV